MRLLWCLWITSWRKSGANCGMWLPVLYNTYLCDRGPKSYGWGSGLSQTWRASGAVQTSPLTG